MRSSHPLRTSSLCGLSALVLLGCGSGSGDNSPSVTTIPLNTPPVITSIDSVSIDELSTAIVIVNAVDNEGDALSYQWQQTFGSPVELLSDNSDTLSFVAPAVKMSDESEMLSFEVSVSDGNHEALIRSVDVVVSAIAIEPTLELAHQQVETYGNHTLQIECSAADIDGAIADLTVTQIAGDDIMQPSSVECPLTIPLAKEVTRSIYTFNVIASDEDGLTVQRQLEIAVRPLPKLSDTGVTTCADSAGANSDSASIGLNCLLDQDEDGDLIPAGQDGKTGMSSSYFLLSNDGFQYTKLDADGNILPNDAEEFSCIVDDVTNLLWEVKTEDGGLHSRDNTYSWYLPDDTVNGGVIGTRDNGTCNHSFCDTAEYVRHC